jgi:putative ABC transport system permease protein
LLIATLVIAGTVSLSIRLRHRDVALLRAIAATPRQVRRMVIVESAVVGIVAAGAGIWPGLGIAAWLRGQFVSRGMVPDSFHTHLSWLPPLVAASAALLVAIVAAWIAGLRTSRVRPTEALGETAVERRGIGIVRAFAGLVALGGGITLSVVSESASGDSAASISVGTVATLVTAIGLLAPLLIRAAAATFGRALHAFGVSGRLAAATTATSAYRLSAVVTSMVLAVALGGSLWFVETSTEHAASRQVRAGLTADYVITGNAGGVTPSVVTAMRQTDGVVAATGVVRSTVFTSNDLSDYAAQGIDAGTSSRVLDLGVVAGSLANLHGNSVAIDKLTAGSLHLGVGDQFTGWFGDGAPARLRVVALYTRGLGFAAFTLPRDVLAPHVSSGFDDAVFVAVGADRASTAGVMRREVAALAPGSTLLPRDAYRVGLDANLVENAWANQTVTAVLVVYVAIAAVNTLVMYALGRRREFAVLRLSGTTRRQLFAVVRLEQTLLLGIALVIGVAIAAATLLPMVKGITGSATPYIPATGWVTVFGGTILLSLVGTLVPVRRALRMRPVEAIGIRE